ncbi:MAG TPA: ATP-binding cassette domain-containing protein, partial [Alicycliphilus sp.]|nr:ATP-binding cassette domain-containing protein [Alicycliphilus sp.]
MSNTPPLVEIRGLATVFGKGAAAFTVHENLQLSVRRGEILSIVGGSGTGKTVLLHHILGLTRPTRGSVTVAGRPATELGGEGASSRVGMLFQQGALFSAFNVLDNIAFALRELGTLPPALIDDAAMVKLRLAGLNIFKLLRHMREELLIVLGTSSSESALPLLMDKLEALGCKG